jgi:hypothetical protein
VRVHVVPSSPRGVDLPAALARLRAAGTLTLLVDRLVVAIAPTIIGAGTEAVGTLGITTVADGIRLVDRRYTCSTTTCAVGVGRCALSVECVLVTSLCRIPAKCQVGACLL